MGKIKENTINNTFQIEKEFNTRLYLYSRSRSTKTVFCSPKAEKNGKVKVFTKEEIEKYKYNKGE